MRVLAAVLVGLILTNVFIARGRRAMSQDREAAHAEATELARAAERAERDAEHRRSLEALVANAERIANDPRSISELRESLTEAERGLPIRRLSLDFRPEQQLPAGLGGSRVHATLRGPFNAIYHYLARIEARRLPLVPESLTLRSDDGEITATLRWAARWPVDADPGAASLSPSDVSRLNAWLLRERKPRAARNVFTFATRPAGSNEDAPISSGPVDEPTELPSEGGAEELPVLTGFVLARPELEPDVRRRVLAAVRFEGALRLVMIGDTFGVYVVERVEARDSVTLKRTDTGERVRLTLD